MVDSGKERSGGRSALAESSCALWARAEKGHGMGWEGGPQDQLGPGDFWRPPGEGEVLK